jgi:CheY-like chemotaxis protein
MPHSILIVDDEAPIRDLIRRKLESCGYAVTEAADGRDAIRALRGQPFNVVITDIMMPDTNGIELACHVRKNCPQTKLIAISAPGNGLFLDSAGGLGAHRTFSKPLVLAELAAAVEELLGHSTGAVAQ